MTTLLIVLALLAGAYLVAVIEGWTATGRFRPAAPILAGVALLGRESVVPRKPDRIFFEVGPVLLLVSAVLAAAVLPLAPGLIIADLATGALFVNAALVYVMVALLMAGWGPDGAYAMVGGFRFLGQLVGYSMPIVMAIAAIAMRAESLLTTEVVESQATLWNAIYQPIGFVLFFLAAMALCFLPPFDLPTAPGELAGGVLAEYTGWRLAVARLARLGLENAPFAAVFGLVALLVGLGYKAAIAPFHFWAPDAYDGAPVAVAAFLSVVPKVGAIFGLAQVVRDLPTGATAWPLVVAALAALSMTYGNLAALVQENVVRLLAYSSIAQSGYFLLGVVALGRSDLAIPSLVVFAAAYAAMNLGAFAVVARAGRDLPSFAGLGRSAPWTGAAMVVFLISLVGIPPLGGFVGKFLLFGAAIDAGFTWLAVVAILNSVLSLGVYLRIVVPMYQQPKVLPSSAPPVAAVVGITLVLTVAVGLAARALLGRIP